MNVYKLANGDPIAIYIDMDSGKPFQGFGKTNEAAIADVESQVDAAEEIKTRGRKND